MKIDLKIPIALSFSLNTLASYLKISMTSGKKCFNYCDMVRLICILHINIQGVLILCAQKLTTYKIIIGEHCGVILFVKF